MHLPDTIPEINSPVTCLYIHHFVDVDDETLCFVSPSRINTRKHKFTELSDMFCLTLEAFPTREEIQFLFDAEQDVKVKKKLKSMMICLEAEKRRK